MKKRVLLAAKYSVVEPLGLMYLSAAAKAEGWEPKVVLVDEKDRSVFNHWVTEFQPDIVGFSTYTGGHQLAYECLDYAKRNGVATVIGGPHATCFPKECHEHADYVVRGEGVQALSQILSGSPTPGVYSFRPTGDLPLPDRLTFYNDYPEHFKSPIKSIIGNYGCPFACSYCYNSMDKGLFPLLIRSVDAVIAEVRHLLGCSPETELIYFQDDVFGIKVPWLEEFVKQYRALGTPAPVHAQTRFEFLDTRGASGDRRLNLLKEMGCTGLTMAIESADPLIRREVLGRHMTDESIVRVVHRLADAGIKLRTEQMLGLPCGATSKPTKIDLEADLATLQLNVRLREQTGLPTMAWASILVPYRGTRIWSYCRYHGFYRDDGDVPETFFEESVLRFPKYWVGPTLDASSDAWMDEGELAEYHGRVRKLRDAFHLFALISNGDKLAAEYVYNDMNHAEMLAATKTHLYDSELYGVG